MKLETGMVVSKGLAFVVVGFCAPMATALAQYANTDTWPTRIVWVVIVISAITGAANAYISYVSGSFSDYMTERKKSGDTNFFPKPPEK